MKRIAKTLVTAALAWLGTTTAYSSDRVYFGTIDDGIYSAAFDAKTGKLSGMERAIEISKPTFIAFHPTRALLYATSGPEKWNAAEGAVAAMKIEPNGSLTLLNKRSSKGYDACFVGLDPEGKMVMATNYVDGSVVSFAVQEDGSLSEMRSIHVHEGSGENAKRQESAHPHSIFAHPTEGFAYVPDLGMDQIVIYKTNVNTGELVAAGSAAVPGGGAGPRHMKWSADGDYAYLLNELALNVSVFKMEKESGSLKFVTNVPVLSEGDDKEEMSGAEIRIHPNGEFVYTSSRDLARKERDSISIFRVNEGMLTLSATVPAMVSIPRNFNIDPTGNWLLVGGQRSNSIAVFKIDAKTGLLTHQETIACDFRPMCIEFLNNL